MLIVIREHVTQCYNGPLMLFLKKNYFWTTAWLYGNRKNENMIWCHALKFILYWRGDKIVFITPSKP